VSSGVNELVVSFFGNGYITYCDVEITDYIYETPVVPRKDFVAILRQRGYSIKDITEELDRQCYASTLRYIPSEDVYVGVDMGRYLWQDILGRIHDQKSMVGGRIEKTDSGVKLDIYRTDFQSLKFKRLVNHVGFNQAPVMRWTRKFKIDNALQCLDPLLDVVPPGVLHGKADRLFLLQAIREANRSKSRKTTWAWLITHPVMRLELTPSRECVVRTVLSLSNGPVDWKGKLVSFDDLRRTGLSRYKIDESLEYLENQGVIRRIQGGVTPTGQGYVLLQYAWKTTPSVTFAVVHVKELYRLEISIPADPGSPIRDILTECGGKFSDDSTLAVFSECEKSEVTHLIDALIEGGLP
jgi:hypothetical protein